MLTFTVCPGRRARWNLGLDEAMGTALCLIEWPDRLGTLIPADALTLDFRAGALAHQVTLNGPGWAARLEGCLDAA